MRFAIIETGQAPPSVRERHPSYADMMARMLTPLIPDLSILCARPYLGEDLPAPNAFDAMLLTGSPAGVYERHSWIAPLENLVRAAAEANRRQIGICFGHQLMAQALGGRVEKSDKGWGVGVHRYKVSGGARWMDPPQNEIACVVSHQDQVIELPPGASTLAGSQFCPHGIISYAQGPAISFQMHPEFDHDFAADLMEVRRERLGSAADDGLASLRGSSDRQLLARWIANFLRHG